MAKKFKTNALRMLDKAKIPYSIKEYEYDEEHLDGRHVASQVDMIQMQSLKHWFFMIIIMNILYVVCLF